MNNSRDIQSQALAKSQLNHFKGLIENHCPKFGPLRSVFQTFENGELAGMPAYDPNHPEGWAQDYLKEFLAGINCADMPITLVLRDKNLPKRDSDKELLSPIYHCHDTRYYTDQYGRPVIYAEPSKLGHLGYLARRLTLAISSQIQLASQTERELSEDDQRHLCQLTAVFLGLSLVLTPSSRSIATDDAIDNAEEDNLFRPNETKILFATVLYWRLKGQKYEHAMSLYGDQYNAGARKILKSAFTCLQDFNDEIVSLRQCVIERCQDKSSSAVA